MLAMLHVSEVDVIRAILATGIDVNQRSHYNSTALMIGADMDNELIVELLKAGAEVNLQDNEGDTALMRALYSQNHTAISLLLQEKGDWSLKNNVGKDVMMLAQENNNAKVIEEVRSVVERQRLEDCLNKEKNQTVKRL